MSKQIREWTLWFNSKNEDGGINSKGKYLSNGWIEYVDVIDYESYQRLLDANKNLEKIIAKELSENDEFGAEFVHVIECPNCHQQNSFASILPSEYLHEF